MKLDISSQMRSGMLVMKPQIQKQKGLCPFNKECTKQICNMDDCPYVKGEK